MEKLGTAARAAISHSQISPQQSRQVARRIRFDENNLPVAYDHIVDYALPQKLWSAWVERGTMSREIRRPMTTTERATVQRRVDLLEPALLPYARPEEDDRVAEAVAAMFGSFTSMRDKGAAAVSRVKSCMDCLADLPAWAIEQGCLQIRRHGYEVEDGGRKRLEQSWPPSDAQVHSVAAAKVDQRMKALASARALLAAPAQGVEPEADPGSVVAMHADFKTKMAGGALLAQMEDAERERIVGDASKRALQARRDDYVAAGLDPPSGATFASLPMLLKRGWTIEERISGNVLIAPARASVGPAPKRPTQANEMGS